MILFDSDILSTFGKIDKLELLFVLFDGEEICISSNVFNEVKRAEEKGYEFAEKVISLIKDKKIKVIYTLNDEFVIMTKIPYSFGNGERDSIAIAKKRGATFATNEKRIWNFCYKESINCLSLNSLLKILWKDRILTKQEVKDLIKEIETKDKVIIASKEEIFDEEGNYNYEKRNNT